MTSTPTGAIPATAEMMARIHEVGPVLRDNAAKADAERRVPEASIDALMSTGVFGLNTPERYGGMGAGARAMVEAATAIGYYCTNASWISVISSVSTVLPSRFPETLYERMYAAKRPQLMASVITSPRAEAIRDGEGYRVSGEWHWASNIWHSDWALGFVSITDGEGGEPEPGFVFLHRDHFAIRDVWFTIGMRGTGSNVFEADDARVPDDHVVPAGELLGPKFEQSAEADFTQRLTPISLFGTTIASPPLGAARAALDLTIEAADQRSVTYSSYRPQNSSPVFAHGIGTVRAKIDTAEMCLLRAADAIDAAAMTTEPLSREARAQIRNDVGHATHNLGEAMNDIAWLYGTSLFAESSPLGRLWRDVHTGIRHAITAAPLNYEIGGAAALGVDGPAPML